MSSRQRGLGRGLGALIAPADTTRPAVSRGTPSDVFFNGPAAAGKGSGSGPMADAGTPESIDLTGSAGDPAGGSEAAAEGRVVGELRLLPVDVISPIRGSHVPSSTRRRSRN